MGKDMRDWIARLEEAGELHTVKRPVDPRTEMGALLYQSRDRGLLFESLTGYPGWRVLGQARLPIPATRRSPSTRPSTISCPGSPTSWPRRCRHAWSRAVR